MTQDVKIRYAPSAAEARSAVVRNLAAMFDRLPLARQRAWHRKHLHAEPS